MHSRSYKVDSPARGYSRNPKDCHVSTTENKSDKVSQGRHLSLVLRNQTARFTSFGHSMVTMGRTGAKIQIPGSQTTPHLEVKEFADKGPLLPLLLSIAPRPWKVLER